MTLYLRLGGTALIMIAALLICHGYELYLNKRLEEYCGLILLISHVEEEISLFLSYGSRLWSGFHNDALEKCGLLSLLREGHSISSAFSESMRRMSLSKTAAEELSKEFDRLGKGYKDSELRLLSSIRERLSLELESERCETEKNLKVLKALLLGGALVAVVMVM